MNIQKMMKDFQKKQSKVQEEIEALEVDGTSGGGAVIVRMNGRKDLTALTLSPEAVTPDDIGLMQDLILAAVNDAGRRVDAEVQRKMDGLTGGLKIPGLS